MQNALKIKILSDDNFFARKVEHRLKAEDGWTCLVKNNVEREIDVPDLTADIVIIAYDFIRLTPEIVLEKLKTSYPQAKIIGIVPENSLVIMKDFLLDKDVIDIVRMCDIVYDMIFNHVINIRQDLILVKQLRKLSKQNSEVFLSKAHSMSQVQELINKAANSDINVSIFGETGTGKEVAARRIHSLSKRADAPFVAVNVTAIPSELIESSFFGHEKGAFTGAASLKKGFFEAASGGTLFLDEIGDMDLKMQTKILRALQEGVITRVGGTNEIKIDTRIITATHVNLQEAIEKGTFREDLFYRLMGLNINMPRLSDRGEDILLLANHFIREYCTKSKKPLCKISKKAQDVLLTYSFPGNIRELKAMIELAIVLSEDNIIKAEDLTLRTSCVRKKDFLEEERTLEEYEAIIIKHFLEKYSNKVRLVAEKLNISKTKIYNLLQENKL